MCHLLCLNSGPFAKKGPWKNSHLMRFSALSTTSHSVTKTSYQGLFALPGTRKTLCQAGPQPESFHQAPLLILTMDHGLLLCKIIYTMEAGLTGASLYSPTVQIPEHPLLSQHSFKSLQTLSVFRDSIALTQPVPQVTLNHCTAAPHHTCRQVSLPREGASPSLTWLCLSGSVTRSPTAWRMQLWGPEIQQALSRKPEIPEQAWTRPHGAAQVDYGIYSKT